MVVTSSSGFELADGDRARVEGLAVDVRRARLADVDAAAVLGPGHAEAVPQHPQEADVVGDVHGHGLAVEDEGLAGAWGSPQEVRSRPLVGDCGIGRDEGLGLEGELLVVDREVRRDGPGRPRVGAGHRGEGGGHAGLPGAAGLLLRRRHHDHLDLGRGVPLARVEVVVPAGLEEVAVAQVQAGGQRQGDAVVDAALHLGLEAARVDRQAHVDGVRHLGDPGPGDRLADPAPGGARAAVDLDEAGGDALVLLVDGDALRGAGGHPLAPAAHLGDLVEHREQALVALEPAPELVGVEPHRRGELVDDELAGDAYVG